MQQMTSLRAWLQEHHHAYPLQNSGKPAERTSAVFMKNARAAKKSNTLSTAKAQDFENLPGWQWEVRDTNKQKRAGNYYIHPRMVEDLIQFVRGPYIAQLIEWAGITAVTQDDFIKHLEGKTPLIDKHCFKGRRL